MSFCTNLGQKRGKGGFGVRMGGWVVGWVWGGGLWGKSIHSDRHGGVAIGLSHLSTSHYPLLGNIKDLISDSSKANDAFCQLTGNIESVLLKLQIMIQIRRITIIGPIKIKV